MQDSIVVRISTDTLIAKNQAAPFMKKGQFVYQYFKVANGTYKFEYFKVTNCKNLNTSKYC